MLLAVLHFLPAGDGPAGIVAALARALAPGSYLAISHVTTDFAPACGNLGTPLPCGLRRNPGAHP